MSTSYTSNISQPVGNVTISAGSAGYTLGSIASGTVPMWNGTTTTGTSYSWVNPSTNIVSNNGKPILSVPTGKEEVVLEKTATLDVQGTVRINGIDLEERLKTIERLLHIPERDAIMEAKYPSLKKKYDEYINALEKYRTFERIKGEDDGTT